MRLFEGIWMLWSLLLPWHTSFVTRLSIFGFLSKQRNLRLAGCSEHLSRLGKRSAQLLASGVRPTSSVVGSRLYAFGRQRRLHAWVLEFWARRSTWVSIVISLDAGYTVSWSLWIQLAGQFELALFGANRVKGAFYQVLGIWAHLHHHSAEKHQKHGVPKWFWTYLFSSKSQKLDLRPQTPIVCQFWFEFDKWIFAVNTNQLVQRMKD